jgi:hypothetical protein
MNSRKKIRAIRSMIAEAQRKLATAKSPAERPSELLAGALSSIDDLLLELPTLEHPRDRLLENPKKRLPN